MDDITLILVTAFLNAAVSTGIFLRVQRNIGLEFDEKLEKFKTELQKEVIEHEVKFSKTYPKTLEVLEIFTGRFQDFEEAFGNQRDNLIWSNDGFSSRDFLYIYGMILDCEKYFATNRHFLADTIVDPVENIVEEAKELGLLSMELSGYYRDNEKDKIKTLQILHDKGAAYNPNWQLGSDVYKDFETIGNGIKELVRRLEVLYKSVAQAQ